MSLELANSNQCHYLNSRGQRCRMLLASDGDSLCPFHLRLSQAVPTDPEALAAELLDGTGNLNTADRVNALLGNLVKQLARQRIDRQDALAIGYLAQLLLNSVPEVQKEYQAIRAAQARQARLKSIAESQARLRPQQHAKKPEPSVVSSDASSEEALLAAVLQATSPQHP